MRARPVTWTQVRVGGLILAGLIVLGFAIVQLGRAANLFTRRYPLVTFLPNAAGLRQGSSVLVAGKLAGVIESIDFLPPTGDTTRHLEIHLAVDVDVKPQIRGDSRVIVRSLGLLGDRVLDITPGSPRYAALPAGDTLPAQPAIDYQAVIAQASAAVGDLVTLTRQLRTITGGIAHGEGTMGQLITNRSLYDQLDLTLRRMNGVLGHLDRRNGTFARLMDDPTLYHRVATLTAQMDSVVTQMHSRHGTIGRLLTNDTLYTHLVGATARADSVLSLLTSGRGTAGRLLTDQTLYDQLEKTLTDLNAILADLRRDPRRYTKGMVKVF